MLLLRAQVEKLKKEMAKQDAALRKYESEIAELRQVFCGAESSVAHDVPPQARALRTAELTENAL